MRLDYTLYLLGAILLAITVLPLIVPIEPIQSEARPLWIVTGAVLGLMSIGLGYTQRPKTRAQSCSPPVAVPPSTETEPQTAREVKEKLQTKYATKAMDISKTEVNSVNLTTVKGIGEKRAAQLKALGITNAEELTKASATKIAKSLKTSRKTTNKWIVNAKKLLNRKAEVGKD